MKLIGSLTEQQHREDLIALQVYFKTHTGFEATSMILDGVSGGKGRYFLLNVIPDQFEEYFELILDETYLVFIEIPDDKSMRPQVRSVTFLDEHARKIGRSDQIRISVARDLIGKLPSRN